MQNQSILNTGLLITLEDIRNPLACIQLSAEMLKDDNLTEAEKRTILTIIYNSCGHINENVIELCDFLNTMNQLDRTDAVIH